MIIVIAGLMAFASCKKDEPTEIPETQQTSVMDYLPLTPGNYWVYEQNYYDSSGNVLNQSWGNDTIEVISDTTINNFTYNRIVEHNFVGFSTPDTTHYRDSSDCIVNKSGKIIFRLTPGFSFTDYYIYNNDTLCYIDYSRVAQSAAITVPAGTFDCLDYQGALYRKEDNYSVPYLFHNHYCENIGLVKKTRLYLSNLSRLEYNLISYHIQ